MGIGHWEEDKEKDLLQVITQVPLSPCSPCFLISHSPHSMPYALCPIPQLKDILKTVVANYALDKLKIEIAGNLDPVYPHLSSGIDWAISPANFLPSRQFM